MSLQFPIGKISDNPFSSSPPETSPDPLTASCEAEAILTKQNLLNKGLSDDLKMRRNYALYSFILAVFWVAGMFALLVSQGCLGGEKRIVSEIVEGEWVDYSAPLFHLSDNVLIAVIGGTTGSILSIFLVVMKNLFPAHSINRTISSKDF